MDMLDFDADELYFDEPISDEVKYSIDLAADSYSDDGAEKPLLRAYFLEPEHPLVLVALYRFYYYQHRLKYALLVSERVLKVFSARLALPADWNQLTENDLNSLSTSSITNLRFYLLSLKGAGYLELRLGEIKSAIKRFNKVIELDSDNHFGARDLLDIALNKEKELSQS